MEPQTFNKNGKVYKYTDLDEILRLNIPDPLREEFQTKFNKRVFFDRDGSCRMGTLVGLEINEQLSSPYYIIDTGKKRIYVPYGHSLTII